LAYSIEHGSTAQVCKAGAAYFALIFGAGFVLGSVRVPLLVPYLGERIAELIEMPFMFTAIVWSARHVIRRFGLQDSSTPSLLATGALALVLLASAELMLAAVLQSRSIADYIASRDPVSGSVYLVMLVLFALMPLIMGRRRWHRLSRATSSDERTA
jgi:hypothetical protein